MAQGLTESDIARLVAETRRQVAAGREAEGRSAGVVAQPEGAGVARCIDHTLLKAEANAAQIAQLCREAREHRFAAVCVNSAWVPLAAELLRGSEVAVCSVVGFPLGAALPEAKAAEARLAIAAGAREIDMVLHIGALRDGDLGALLRDIRAVVATCHERDALCKVILETALLGDEEKVIAAEVCRLAGADFVKTSTGFGGGGATVADVALLRRVVGPEVGVKASGGVRSLADAQAMLAAGATRIGASASVAIVRGEKARAASVRQRDDRAPAVPGPAAGPAVDFSVYPAWQRAGEGGQALFRALQAFVESLGDDVSPDVFPWGIVFRCRKGKTGKPPVFAYVFFARSHIRVEVLERTQGLPPEEGFARVVRHGRMRQFYVRGRTDIERAKPLLRDAYHRR